MEDVPALDIEEVDKLSATMVASAREGRGGSSRNALVDFATAQNEGEYDPSKLAEVKEIWVSKQMKAREHEFTECKAFTLWLGSWNVNGKRPGESLVPWLFPRDDVPPPDIIAVGFQELDLGADALLFGSTGRSEPWHDELLAALSKHGEYSLLASRQLVGILTIVFIKTNLREHVTHVLEDSAGVGIMGMGNKGGVGIRFQLYDSTICIVNSHLAAHFDHVQRRNQDYHDIARRLQFATTATGAPQCIFDHDHLFWIGDLNYRIQQTNSFVRKKISKGEWDALVKFDQLRKQMSLGNCFIGFQEGSLAFAPTYKYDPNTDIYDTSDKQRVPAWCDRVLWKSSGVSLRTYERHELLTSDHRPVSALAELECKKILPDKKADVYADLVKKLDKMENECMPDAHVSDNTVIFDDVRYLIPSTRTITITNTSKVIVRFQFIPKLDEKKFCKPWLWVTPPFGLLPPGESLDISLTVHIDDVTAPKFNADEETMDDILILHLDKGKDYFISVSGNYLKSCFGNTLSRLVRFPLPIRESSASRDGDESDEKRADTTTTTTSGATLSTPKELWRILDYIYKHGMDKVDLFLNSGLQEDMEHIRELLDTGVSFDAFGGSVHSMAETLIRFLDSLAEPIVPVKLYKQVLDGSGTLAQCKQILTYMPPVHFNAFYYLMSFLREVLTHSEKNKLTPYKLAVLFSSVMIKPPPNKGNQVNQAIVKKKAEFIHHFLNASDKLSVS